MSRFRVIRQVADRALDDARQELGRLVQVERSLVDQQNSIQAELAAAAQGLETAWLNQYHAFSLHCRQRLQELKMAQQLVRDKKLEAENALLSARKHCKSIEYLQNREQEELVRRERRREQRQLDAWISLHHATD